MKLVISITQSYPILDCAAGVTILLQKDLVISATQKDV